MSYGHRPSTIINPNQSPTMSPSHPPPGPVPQARNRVPSTRSRTTSSLSAPPSPSARTRAHAFSSHSTSPSPSSMRPPHQPQRTPSSPLPTSQPSPKLPSPLNSPLQFDMKRLLSKPAPPYARGHGYGSGSESEGTYASRMEAGKGKARVLPRDDERSREVSLSTSFDIDIDTGSPLDLDLDSFGVGSSPQSRLGESIPSSTSHAMPATPSPSRPHEPEKRARNVLKRRPSATVSTHASATTVTTAINRTPTMGSSAQSPDIPRSSLTTGKSPKSSTTRSPMTPGTYLQTTPSPSTTPTTATPKPAPSRALVDTHDPHTPAPSRAPTRPHTITTIYSDSPTGKRRSIGAEARTPIYAALATSHAKIGGNGTLESPGQSHRPRDKERDRLGPDSHLRRRREDSESRSRSRSRSRTPGEGSKSAPLTPAGAVVEAYKRQEEARRSAGSGSPASGHSMQHRTTLHPPGGGYGRSGSVSASESAISFGRPMTDGEDDRSRSRSRKETGFDVIERVVGGDQRRDDDAERLRRKELSRKVEEDGEDEASAPYYTVIGSTSGRVVAVGGPEDISLDRYHWDSSSLGPGLGRRSISTGPTGKPSTGIARTLSRKVSGRWRKGGEMSGGEEERKLERGRPSLQERRVGRFSNVGEQDQKIRIKNRRSLRLSIDKFVDEDGGVIALSRKDAKNALTQPLTPLTGTVVAESEGEGDAWARQRLKSRRSDPGGGNKIWKLVKRISTGGLREKYNHYDDDDPPPVPALPKDYHLMPSGPRSADGHTTPHQHQKEPSTSTSSPSTPPQTGGLSRFMPSRSSSTGAPKVPSALTRRKSSIALGTGSKVISPPQSMPQSPIPPVSTATPIRQPSKPSPSHTTNSPNPRPSTTTRSSSPNSSDVASSRFFQRQSSARSSTSSLFGNDDPPPMPKPLPKQGNSSVGQHIIPPSELYRMHSEEDKSSGKNAAADTPSKSKKLKLLMPSASRASDDWMIVHTPAVELQSLPIPPRRVPPPKFHSTADSDSSKSLDDRSASPIIPAFSTSDAINTFGPSSRRTSTDTRKSKPSPITSMTSPAPSPVAPPPRPSRSSHRPAPNPNQSITTNPARPSARRGASENTTTSSGEDYERRPEKYNPSRRSSGGHSTASTARPIVRRRSSSLSSSLLSSPPRRTMTFRELGSSEEKQQLTEQEKADRWDDLLERSARAGGTLHLGAGGGEDGLRSDRLRFSNFSEAT